MHVLQVFIKVKADQLAAFQAATIENAQHSLQEAGVVRFDFLQQADDPTRFTLIEMYRAAEDPAKHKETNHYKKWAETVTDMLAEPRTRTVYKNIFPL